MPIADLIDHFLSEEFEASPVFASSLGLTEYDDRLDDLSAETFRRRDADATRWRQRFEGVPDAELDEQQRIDRDLAIAVLRGREILADWEGWRRDPQAYTGTILQGVFGLFLHRLRPEPELAAAAAARLADAPRALEQGMANLSADLAHPLIVCAWRRSRARRRPVPPRAPAGRPHARPRPRPRRRRGGAMPPMRSSAGSPSSTTSPAAPKGHGSSARSATPGSCASARRCRTTPAVCATSGRPSTTASTPRCATSRAASTGRGDWAAVLEAANRDHPPTEEAMRAGYEAWTERARQFLVDTGLTTMPDGERCLVEPSPVFQRPVLGVASYAAPPAFSDVPARPLLRAVRAGRHARDGDPGAPRRERMGQDPDDRGARGVPGPPLAPRRCANPQPSRIRKVFGTPYFNEGWALYTERVMRERGFFTEPLQELYHLNATIFRAARIVVDTSLHLGEMSHDEAVAFMSIEDGAARGDGPRRGRALLRLADPGLGLPHRLPADPSHPRAVPRRARCRRSAGAGAGRRSSGIPRRTRVFRQPAAGTRRTRGDGSRPGNRRDSDGPPSGRYWRDTPVYGDAPQAARG